MYHRLSLYLNYLKQDSLKDAPYISATAIANELGLNDVLVRKDLAVAGKGGKPKIGYSRSELIADIEMFLGYNDSFEAVLVGVGNLGKALLSHKGFEDCGLKIAVAFDSNPELIGTQYKGKKILSSAKISDLCKRLNISIGILTVPAACAQEACDALVEGGVRAVWNFTPANLKTPESVSVKNEDMSASLAILIKLLTENLEKREPD
jgi:redox-sensing transcriptional repressor